MYLVQQVSRFHCFPVCLVSYFTDLHLPLEQNEIINRCPTIFNKGKDIEGAFDINENNLKKVANEFNIEIIIPASNNIRIDKYSTLFFLCIGIMTKNKHIA